jgi:hypothetical protein
MTTRDEVEEPICSAATCNRYLRAVDCRIARKRRVIVRCRVWMLCVKFVQRKPDIEGRVAKFHSRLMYTLSR